MPAKVPPDHGLDSDAACSVKRCCVPITLGVITPITHVQTRPTSDISAQQYTTHHAAPRRIENPQVLVYAPNMQHAPVLVYRAEPLAHSPWRLLLLQSFGDWVSKQYLQQQHIAGSMHVRTASIPNPAFGAPLHVVLCTAGGATTGRSYSVSRSKRHQDYHRIHACTSGKVSAWHGMAWYSTRRVSAAGCPVFRRTMHT